MNRLDRLTAILIQLQTKRWITSYEIADRYEISQRTVYRDIRSLEEAGIPIGAEPGRGYYLVEGYRLPPVMFSREEAGAIMIAEKLVNKFADVSVNKNFRTVTDKIKAVLPEADKIAVEELDQSVTIFNSTKLPTQEYPNEFITTIQRALVEKKCVSLSYHANYSQEKTRNRIVDPLGLVFYSNSWHLIGYCKMRSAMRDFRLDRIQQLFLTDECQTRNKPADLNKYFEDYWKKSDLIEVKVWFDNDIHDAVMLSRYYFGYIDEEAKGEGWVMRFAVDSYDYIANWLLSFGSMIDIQKPMALKEKVVQLVKSLSRHYLTRLNKEI